MNLLTLLFVAFLFYYLGWKRSIQAQALAAQNK